MEKPFDLSLINTESLDKFRLATDPIADDTIAKIIDKGLEKQISQMFMAMVQNDSFTGETFAHLGSEMSSVLNDYIEATRDLPKWADTKLILKGEGVFSDHGPEIFMLLNVSSLPLCYSCAKGAQVLFSTGRLVSHNKEIDPLARRLMETAQMVVNVMSPGGLTREGKGLVTIQKIRLIHASIRYFLKQGQYNNTPWDVETYGEPINQEDLTGTLMSFGPVILSGLKQLNVKLSAEEIKAYMHCWKVVGYMMGIDDRLLPDTYEEGFELATRILQHQAAESEAGKALTSSCVDFINYILPGNVFNDLPRFLMDSFLQEFSTSSGIDLSRCIGVEGDADLKEKLILAFTKFTLGEANHLEQNVVLRKITSRFNSLLLQGIIHHYNGGKEVHFSIPPSLQKNWGLIMEWDDYKPLTPSLFGNRLTWQKSVNKIK